MERVSFILLAYNQERFIREAVEGAFAQTYSPLEIILSDDCSSDLTFAVMQEMAAAYKGPHAIRLNRNETNLGLIEHFNRAYRLSSGALIVGAAGDDVSLPQRVQRIADEWRRCRHPDKMVFYSCVQRMTQTGIAYPQEGDWFGHRQSADPVELLSEWGGFVIGATLAATRGIFEKFGALEKGLSCDDVPLLWRGALCGHLHFIDEALVRWRIGGQGLWSCVYGKHVTPEQRLALMKRFLSGCHALVHQARKDVTTAGETKELVLALDRFEEETAFALASVNGSAWCFLVRYVRLWVRNGRVSHALRACVVEYIRISKALGRNRFLWFITEAMAGTHALCKHRLSRRRRGIGRLSV